MKRIFLLFTLLGLSSFGQDTIYVRKTIEKLCSKKFFGRGYVKNGLNRSSKFIARELKKNGARPFFSQGYLQKFPMSVNTFPREVSLAINGKPLIPGKDFLVAPESSRIDADFSMLKEDSVTWKPSKEEYPFLIEKKKKLTWSVSTRTAAYAKVQVLESSMPEKVEVADVHIDNKFFEEFSCNNVCGYLEGKVNNDSMIVFTAHYDHLGGMGHRTFFPGANDNASGTSFVLDLVRYYKKNQPRYKTVFVFFAGEEAGLIGSKIFVERKTIDLSKIKFLINLDLLGTGDDGIMVVNGAILEKEFSLMENINAKKSYVREIKKRGKARNSDHYWFTEAGVPAFFLYTLGGVTYYHDVLDRSQTLPLTDYCDVFRLITDFIAQL